MSDEGQHSKDALSQQLLGVGYDQLDDIKKSVIDVMSDGAPTGLHPQLKTDDRTYWDRLADHVAAIGGSWGFIFGFGAVLALWIGSNLFLTLWHRAFDPYPFIFLNLLLSTLAAIQAPVIMMSQNRQATKDRQAAEHDYLVNLRAELEIMRLHEKLDRLRDTEILNMVTCQNETLELMRQQVAGLSAKIED
ncbi:putative membrane protein [Caulobacter ginsengisoli]|uniref:Membrane protein n=1 Tax=Caulobacter ginsengisoli TaxID=400775 RepID=A0ABU0IVM5_9CAUL|nr:DUF1003 domain-containing protein [Caulobacter ginsengisoli]MDQ0466071.1 putative membrane protein [Caulobacter ginsengisoli]